MKLNPTIRGGFLFYHYIIFKILIAPCITNKNTIAPINKSGLFELNQLTKKPAVITPMLMIMSFDVNIILALNNSSLLFDLCRMKRKIPFAISAKIETTIIVENSGIFSVYINLLITSMNPYVARTI